MAFSPSLTCVIPTTPKGSSPRFITCLSPSSSSNASPCSPRPPSPAAASPSWPRSFGGRPSSSSGCPAAAPGAAAAAAATSMRVAASAAAAAPASASASASSAAAAASCALMSPLGPNYPASLHFQEHRARLCQWWREHLEDKAALVHAAGEEFLVLAEEDEGDEEQGKKGVHVDKGEEGEEEDAGQVVIRRPVVVDCSRDMYPPQHAWSLE